MEEIIKDCNNDEMSEYDIRGDDGDDDEFVRESGIVLL